MAKDKKKKKDKQSAKKGASAATDTLKALAKNPLVADVVAAALVATASALKDSKRARALASEAGEELNKLSRAGAEAGSALWEMALQIGRRSLEAAVADGASKPKAKSAAKKSSTKKSSTKKKQSTRRRKK